MACKRLDKNTKNQIKKQQKHEPMIIDQMTWVPVLFLNTSTGE